MCVCVCEGQQENDLNHELGVRACPADMMSGNASRGTPTSLLAARRNHCLSPLTPLSPHPTSSYCERATRLPVKVKQSRRSSKVAPESFGRLTAANLGNSSSSFVKTCDSAQVSQKCITSHAEAHAHTFPSLITEIDLQSLIAFVSRSRLLVYFSFLTSD